MGNVIMAASSSKSSGASLLPIILIVVLFMIVYMTMTRRKRASQAQQMQNTIQPGARVRTSGGMYGTVTSVEGDDVMVEVAPGVNIRMMKRAVVPAPQDASTGTGPVPDAPPEPPADAKSDDEHEPRADDWNPQDRNI